MASETATGWLNPRAAPPTVARRTLSFLGVFVAVYFYQSQKTPDDPAVSLIVAVILAAATTATIHWISRLSNESGSRRSLRVYAGLLGSFFAILFAVGVIQSPSATVYGPLTGAALGVLAAWLVRPSTLWASLPNSMLSTLLALCGSVVGAVLAAVLIRRTEIIVRLIFPAVGIAVILLWIVTLIGFAALGDGSSRRPSNER